VFEKSWDLLILLDCATPTMMREVTGEYEFIDNVDEITSVGTCSNQWMENTFLQSYEDEMRSTVHITANTSSEAYLDSEWFQYLEEVWRDGWDEETGTIPAEEVTDRSVQCIRNTTAERYIVHYMQPHLPFVTRPDIESNVVTEAGVRGGDGKSLKELRESGYNKEQLWDASLENLRYVLDSVAVLLSNVHAERAIISADHGQAFGEQGVWRHPCGTYIDSLTQVPWCPTTAVDTGEYEPEYEMSVETDQDRVSLEEKLEALGYK